MKTLGVMDVRVQELGVQLGVITINGPNRTLGLAIHEVCAVRTLNKIIKKCERLPLHYYRADGCLGWLRPRLTCALLLRIWVGQAASNFAKTRLNLFQ